MRLLLILVFVPTVCFAQTPRALPPLKKADFAAMGLAREELEGKPIGESREWSSDETGNSGKVKLLKSEKLASYDCDEIHHDVKIKAEGKPRAYRFWSCKVDGKWKTLTDSEVKKYRKQNS